MFVARSLPKKRVRCYRDIAQVSSVQARARASSRFAPKESASEQPHRRCSVNRDQPSSPCTHLGNNTNCKMSTRPGLSKRPSSNGKDVSPPPSKRRQQSTTTSSSAIPRCASLLTRLRQGSRQFLYTCLEERARENDLADSQRQLASRTFWRGSAVGNEGQAQNSSL